MPGLLKKLSVFLVLLVAWVIYDNWDRINTISPETVKQAVVHSLPDLPSDKKASKVYQWEDNKGKVHISNTPPPGALNVKVIEYADDLNVVVPSSPPEKTKKPGIKMQEKKQTQNNKSMLNTYKNAVKDAREVQDAMNQRNKILQDNLK